MPTLNWDMRRAYLGMDAWPAMDARKVCMVLLVAIVRGPFHFCQCVVSQSNGSRCMVSALKRWGSFWMVHWINIQRWVWRLGMLASKAVMF